MGCRAPVIPALALGRHFAKYADCWRVHAMSEITGVNSAVSSYSVLSLFAETVLTRDITLLRAYSRQLRVTLYNYDASA